MLFLERRRRRKTFKYPPPSLHCYQPTPLTKDPSKVSSITGVDPVFNRLIVPVGVLVGTLYYLNTIITNISPVNSNIAINDSNWYN